MTTFNVLKERTKGRGRVMQPHFPQQNESAGKKRSDTLFNNHGNDVFFPIGLEVMVDWRDTARRVYSGLLLSMVAGLACVHACVCLTSSNEVPNTAGCW